MPVEESAPMQDSFMNEIERQAQMEEETQKLMMDQSTFKSPDVPIDLASS